MTISSCIPSRTIPRRLLCIPAIVVATASLGLSSLHAEEVLWDITFDEISSGAPLEGAAFTPPSAMPQKVSTDNDNTLIGASALGDQNKGPLVFKKGSQEKYLPNFELILPHELNSGVVTITWDLSIEEFLPNDRGETLMNFSVYGVPGNDYRLTIIGDPSQMRVNTEGLKNPETEQSPKLHPFTLGEILHFRAVLDMNAHTFEVFINDEPFAEAFTDAEKFSFFKGFRIGEGTALGGNYGATFTAAIDNLKVTLKD